MNHLIVTVGDSFSGRKFDLEVPKDVESEKLLDDARDQVRDTSLSAYNDEEMRTLLAEAKKYLPVTELRGI